VSGTTLVYSSSRSSPVAEGAEEGACMGRRHLWSMASRTPLHARSTARWVTTCIKDKKRAETLLWAGEVKGRINIL